VSSIVESKSGESDATTEDEAITRVDETTKATRGGQVIGVDGSPGSTHALEWAVAQADTFGDVQPVVAWQYPWWTLGTGLAADPLLPPPDDFAAAARTAAQSALDNVDRTRLSTPIVCRSNAGPALVEFGASADLIVVGTRGHGAVTGTILGSVSSHVVAHARTPVAVVPMDAPTEPLSSLASPQVVVGIDGSENSIAALTWALRSLPPAATILAVHTWGTSIGAAPELIAFPIENYEAQGAEVLETAVAQAVDSVGDSHGHRVQRLLAFGDPRSVLREKADGADLLVLGARGHRGIAHLLLGSVTTGLVHSPNTVTVVVPGAPS
jgi:nucleotide-binding universal stress UspA family protein